MRKVVALLAFLVVAGCTQERVRADFCDLVAARPLLQQPVRVEAVAMFSDHGASLAHPDCPTERAIWDETDEFQSPMLGEAINELRSELPREPSFDWEDLSVDVDALYTWRNNRPVFIVERVYSVRRAPHVYASQFERDFFRCEMGPAAGDEADEWRAACAASEEWFRAQREASN